MCIMIQAVYPHLSAPIFRQGSVCVLGRTDRFFVSFAQSVISGRKESAMKKSEKKFNTTEYTYYRYDPVTKRDVPVKIVAGQNGVTEEYITMLREMDEANRIADEREERHRDKGFEAKKNRAALNDDGTAYDPFNEIADKSADPANRPEAGAVDKIELVRKFMKELTEEQVTLIYQIYVEPRTRGKPQHFGECDMGLPKTLC